MDVKNAYLQTQGWHNDSQGNFEPNNAAGTVTGNQGLKVRCAWFREDYNLANPWRPEGYTMTGR